MKKLVLIGVVCMSTVGCGRGWLPLFRGAPCTSNCAAPALPAALPSAGCNDCGGVSAGYSPYDTTVLGGEYMGGQVIGGDYLGESVGGYSYPAGESIPMAPLAAPSS